MTGFVLADLIVSAVFTVVMLRWFRPLIRLVFSRAVLEDALRFGLPRVPHGLLQQVMFVADRYVLRVFSVLSEVGLYQMGASFGMALKLVLNAFEYAWAPFYFQTMKTPDAKATFRLITTYGVAGLTLLVAGLAAVGPEIVRWVLPPQFHGAARIVPWIGLARRLPRRLPADVDRPQHHQGDAATIRSRPAPPRSPASSPTCCWCRASAASARRGRTPPPTA